MNYGRFAIPPKDDADLIKKQESLINSLFECIGDLSAALECYRGIGVPIDGNKYNLDFTADEVLDKYKLMEIK